MHVIEQITLKNYVQLQRGMYSFKEAADMDKVTMYAKLCIDIIKAVLNDKQNPTEDSFFLYVERQYGDDPHILEMGEFLVPMIKEMKVDFSTRGFDARLHYNIREVKRGQFTRYLVYMDLDETFINFSPSIEREVISEVVSDNPDLEVMNELLQRSIHPGSQL
jgi:hypothetical protein